MPSVIFLHLRLESEARKELPMIISDTQLTHEGAALANGGRVLVIGCGALAHEILALTRANALPIDLQCLPALLHNTPEKIPAAVQAKIREGRAAGYETVLVAYADCGTGGQLAQLCAAENVPLIAGPHCYSFFEGNQLFESRGEITAFYLTDFLARQFDAIIWRPLKLDNPLLRDMIFGNYTDLVYLAQTEDPDLTARAAAAAQKLGLRFSRRFTGYGELADFLQQAAHG